MFGFSYGQELNLNTIVLDVENSSLPLEETYINNIQEMEMCDEYVADQAHIFKNNTKKFIEWYLPFRIEVIKRMFMMA